MNGADAAAPLVAGGGAADVPEVRDEVGEGVKAMFLDFFNNFSSGEGGPGGAGGDDPSSSSARAHPHLDYVEQAENLVKFERFTMYVNFAHVAAFSQDLADTLLLHYFRVDVYLRRALYEFMKQRNGEYVAESRADTSFWVALYNLPTVESLRDLKTAKIGQLTAISGTVTRSTEVRPELITATFYCSTCRRKVSDVQQQFRYTEPAVCPAPNCENRNLWTLEPAESVFADWQRVRVQEHTGDIPAGSMPRSTEVILRNEVVEKAKPGDQCTFVGTLVVVPDLRQLNRAAAQSVRGSRRQNTDYQGFTGLKELGVRDLTYRLVFLACSVQGASNSSPNARDESDEELTPSEFTTAERERIWEMKESPNLYRRMTTSIAPGVHGHDEIKRGILLQLLGGVHKNTQDGGTLRGDVNVCIVGDPSTAKSQFLKYVCDFLPRAVYTSGKASSAAGLTASVVRDPDSGEFTIEAGALMLADNSICAIDEFDKMDVVDQTAIHEAMEQQTISITKAGIQATLNARTSILAAANPIKGRYDRSRTLKQNVAISAPIMSRFDLFFVVLDEGDEVIDLNIAQHIVDLHMHKAAALHPDFSTRDLQTYIRFARLLKPQITPAAKKVLVESYIKLRGGDASGVNKTAYRITVRQLESMVRLAEAQARLHLDEEVRPKYVLEAARLLQKSIIHVDSPDVDLEEDPEEYAPVRNGGGGGGDDDDDDEDDDEDAEEGGGGAGDDDLMNDPFAFDGDAGAGGENGGGQRGGGGAGGAGQKKKRAKRKQVERVAKAAAAASSAASDEAPRQRLVVSLAEYTRVASQLVHHMRAHESSGVAAMAQGELIAWYLTQREAAGRITDEDELRLEMRKVINVIRRLVNVDHVLLVVPPTQPPREGEETPEDERLLEVHPNYDPESATASQPHLEVLREERERTIPPPSEDTISQLIDHARRARPEVSDDEDAEEDGGLGEAPAAAAAAASSSSSAASKAQKAEAAAADARAKAAKAQKAKRRRRAEADTPRSADTPSSALSPPSSSSAVRSPAKKRTRRSPAASSSALSPVPSSPPSAASQQRKSPRKRK